MHCDEGIFGENVVSDESGVNGDGGDGEGA